MNRSIFFLCTAIILNSCSYAQSEKSETSLPASEFSARIKASDAPLIVDVRTPGEFEKGHLEDAVNIDWNGSNFDQRISELDKSAPVFVYCLSGGRSHSAAERMRTAGFAEVIEMSGGMMEWRAKGLPETKDVVVASEMSTEQYQALLNVDKLVLVDFYAEWCAPCKKMKPYLERIALEMGEKVVLVRLDADKNADFCEKMDVTALPVLKLYRDQQLVWQTVGYTEESTVRTQIEKYEKK